MNQNELLNRVSADGYTNARVEKFKPFFDTGKHTHRYPTLQIILDGEIKVTDKNGTVTFYANEEVLFPAGTIHSGKVGPAGVAMIKAEHIN